MNNSKNCWTVYCHTTPSGKRYIGITSKKPEERWRNGRGYIKDTPFGKAIEKYGWNNIKHEILDTDIDEFTAKYLEEYYIFSYQTYIGFKDDCKGYNCTLGGEGTIGFPSPMKGKQQTEESKMKNREAHKGKTPWNKGLKQSEEHRRKNSESHKGQIPWNKDKTGVQVSHNKGKHWKLIDGKHVYYE